MKGGLIDGLDPAQEKGVQAAAKLYDKQSFQASRDMNLRPIRPKNYVLAPCKQ
jgi:hypothetical protein